MKHHARTASAEHGGFGARVWRRLTHAAPILVLGLVALTGVGSGATYALWSSSVTFGADIRTAQVLFAVGDASDGPLDVTGDTWQMPTTGLGTPSAALAPGESFSAVIQLDAVAQGDLGLAAALTSVDIADPTGTGYLAVNLNLTLVPVGAPGECTSNPPPSAAAWYTGPLTDAVSAAHELVSIDDTTTWAQAPNITYLCAVFTLDDGSDDAVTVAPSDADAEISVPTGATSPVVTFTFTSTTYREEPSS